MNRPGIGFGVVCLVYASLACFVAWGLSQPSDEFLFEQAVRIHNGQLSDLQKSELDRLHRALNEHPWPLCRLVSLQPCVQNQILTPHRQDLVHGQNVLAFRAGKTQLEIKRLPGAAATGDVPFQLLGFDGKQPDWNWQKQDILGTESIKMLILPSAQNGSELLQLRFAQAIDARIKLVPLP